MLRSRTFLTLPYTFANILNILRRPNCHRFATWLGLQNRSCIQKISDPPHNCVPIMNGFMTSNVKVNAKKSLNNSNRLNCSWKSVHWQRHDDMLATGDPCLLNLKNCRNKLAVYYNNVTADLLQNKNRPVILARPVCLHSLNSFSR